VLPGTDDGRCRKATAIRSRFSGRESHQEEDHGHRNGFAAGRGAEANLDQNIPLQFLKVVAPETAKELEARLAAVAMGTAS